MSDLIKKVSLNNDGSARVEDCFGNVIDVSPYYYNEIKQYLDGLVVEETKRVFGVE